MNILECPPKGTLKDYISGRLNDEDSANLESHLAACKACEDTACQIDSEPDTYAEILQVFQGPGESSEGADAYSLGPARKLMDLPAAAAGRSDQFTGSVGSYDLVRQLGSGGMGNVYLARHRELQKDVAIKLLPKFTADREHIVNRFRKEMRAVGRLDDPSIVRATDAGEIAGVHFLVMEVVEGMDISRVARLVGPLTIANACEIIRQSALGLAYAHEQGVIHRDIKPSNLMLSPDGRIKILDFGLAQLTYWEEPAVELTTVGQLMGTLDYMAPEQCSHSTEFNTRCDIYSLGATLFKLLSGKPPLNSDAKRSPLEKLRMLSEHQVLPIRNMRADIPDGLANLLDRMLATDPANRPASAKAVAESIEPFCDRSSLQSLLATSMKRMREQNASDSPLLPLHVPENVQPKGVPPLVRWLLTLSTTGFFAVLVAGIFLTLELTKGQLVIESDDADLTVTIASLDSENEFQELQIEPGANVTRLRAGHYEITLSKGSDRFTLSKASFTIRRGDLEVARVMSIDNDAEQTVGEAQSKSVVGDNSDIAEQGSVADPFGTSKRGNNPFGNSKSNQSPFGSTNPSPDPFGGNPFSDPDPNRDPFGENSREDPFGSSSARNRQPTQAAKPNVEQQSTGKSEAEIYAALKEKIEVVYNANPLYQVLGGLSDDLNIPIWINTRKLEELGVTPDEPITLNLPDISAKSALTLMLEPLRLGFLVRNEVLEITSARDADLNSALAQPGDTLAIYIDRIVPLEVDPSSSSPIPVLQAGQKPPVQGLPFPIDGNGYISLPIRGEKRVGGMTLEQIRQAIKSEYINANILKEDEQYTVSVSVAFLMRKGEELPVKNLTNTNSQ